MNVQIVIRSSKENTIDKCIEIAKLEVPKENIKLIDEKPFSNAVKKTFELGIESGQKWTLALDADILLRKHAINDLVKRAESLPDNFFMIQGRVLDKLFCFSRNGGPHLFRTALCKEAMELVPDSSKQIRPESKTVQAMIDRGYHRYKGREVYGLHDFYQSDFDIFRKAVVDGMKFKGMINYFIPEWSRRLKNDPQYLIASIGYLYGYSRLENDWPNHEELLEVWNSDHVLKNLKSANESEIQDSDELINTFIRSPRGEMLERNAHDNILRSDKNTANGRKTSNIISGLLKKIENWAVRNQ